jgi:hypothetical protein
MALEGLAERVQPVALARDQRLTVLAPLEPLLPGGMRRGSTVAVAAARGAGGGATSLALALAAGPSTEGSWVAAVGFPSLGLAAAAELGIALERLVLVAPPQPRAWATALATMIDGFDVVLVRDGRFRSGEARRLTSRARERGTVIIPVGAPMGDAPDVALVVTSARWEGLGAGHGHLMARRVVVESGGRREAARSRRVELWLPAADGSIDTALADPIPLRRGA